MSNIDFEKDQTEVLSKTANIQSLADQVGKLNELQKKKRNEIYLGDIIINLNKMIVNIKDKDFLVNFDRIWIHGLVHLLGHRHKSNHDFSIMTKLENKFIKFSK